MGENTIHAVEIVFLLLLLFVVLFGALARKLKLPYPIVLVIAGLVLSFIPGIPHISLNPDVVFLVFLPPLLYSAAWFTSWRDFKYNNSPVSLPLNLNYWQGPNDTKRAMHDGPVNGTGNGATLAGGSNSGIERCCIDRHQGAINVGFRDGSARKTILHDLWKLQWNLNNTAVDVVGTPPNHLPAPY